MASFADVVRGKVDNKNKGNPQKDSNKKGASDNQINLYKKLCERKNIEFKESDIPESFADMDKLIKETQEYRPVTEQQANAIKRKIENLQGMGVKIQTMSDQEIYSKSGGEDGTASKLIEELAKWEDENKDIAPPSKEQLNKMVEMYNCPDVDFESQDISRIVKLDEQLWRRLTPDEFRERLTKNFNRSQASEFLDKNNVAFQEWRKTRVSKGQKEFIRKLEYRLSKLQNSSEVEFFTDEDGIIQQKDSKTQKDTDNAYCGFEEYELDMLSRNQAGEHIDMLKKELQNKELKNGFNESELDDETHRYTQSVEEAQTNFKQTIEATAYKIQSMIGYKDDELVDLMNNWLVEDPEGASKEGKKCRMKLKNIIEELSEIESDYAIRQALPEQLIEIYEEIVMAEIEMPGISDVS